MVTIAMLSVGVVALVSLVTAVPTAPQPTSSPAPDGFPNPNAQQLLGIEKLAGGTLSNAPPPAKLANSSLTAFQAIAFGENFEVAYFSSLLNNVTHGMAGYECYGHFEKQELANVLETVVAVS
jgi:hypothetical protein